MKKFDTLYARNSNGSINEWQIWVVDNRVGTLGVVIKVSEGLIDGVKTTTDRFVKVGKNIGKMNETSVYEQACNEAQSRWEKKKKQGYKSAKDLNININIFDKNGKLEKETDFVFLSELEKALPQNRTDANNLSKPMKAQPYFDDKGNVRIKFPCYGQPKLNGFRVMARWETVKEGEGIFAQDVEKVVFRSKEGLRYDILEHIEEECFKEMFFPSNDYLQQALDGEMYIHGEILSEISSAVRKRNSKTPKLKFCIFDIAIEKFNQRERFESLELLKEELEAKSIEIIPIEVINSNEEAQEYTDKCIRQGYEGAIFRDMKATYQFGKRPKTMVKLKRSQDKEFKIINVIGGSNSPDLGVFVCLAENGKEFKVTPEGNHEAKKEYLTNKSNYIGKMLTVRFFERTIDELPFHAVGVVRDYE